MDGWMDGWMCASARWECEVCEIFMRDIYASCEIAIMINIITIARARNEKRETRNEILEGWGFVYFFVCLFTSFHIDWVISSLATYYYIVTLSAMKSGGLLISAVRN